MVNDRTISFNVDTGSPVTLIPMAKFNRKTPIQSITEKYQAVNNNNINVVGKTTAEVEINGKKKKLELLLTNQNTVLLIGLNWMKQFGIELPTKENSGKIQNITEDKDERKSDLLNYSPSTT